MFKTTTYGKWILAGEHAVLRGCPALAFPLTACRLDFVYHNTSVPLEAFFLGERGEELKLLFFGVLENALDRLKVSRYDLKGKIEIFNTLPVGAGLGASAALCGAVARWCEYQSWVNESQLYDFARDLEDLFHGESSGVDLAVSLKGQGIRFVRGLEMTPLQVNWWPQMYLSYSGQRGITSECVNKVKAMNERNSGLARGLDVQMKDAVVMAEEALKLDEIVGFPKLKTAMLLARDCFEKWGLCEADLRTHMRSLEEAGAVAVKPTGSGGGGYALSLWQASPPKSLLDKMMLIEQPKILAGRK